MASGVRTPARQPAHLTTVQGTNGWKSLNNGLGITQFYGAAANLQSGKIVGGAQDNGTLFNVPGTGTESWKTIFGGDGGDCAADPVQEFHYGEYVFLQIHRSQGGNPSSYIYQGIADAGSRTTALFIAPFILDPNNSNTMLAGGLSLWRSKNVKQSPPSWAAIKPAASSFISAISGVKGDSKSIWVGHVDGTVSRTANASDLTPTWQTVGAGLPSRYVSRVVLDPVNPKNVYVTHTGYFKGNLSKSTDSGRTWTTLGSAVLPEVPFYDLAIHPNNSKLLYLGTDTGLFVSEDGGANWFPTNQGPTNAPAYRLFWINTTLHVATHGRGMFRINLASPSPTPVIQEKITP